MNQIVSKSRLSRRRKSDRKGAAVVEAALCIPIVIVLMMGTLEVCAGIYLSESLTVCAYEAARAGVRRRADYDDVYDRAVEALADRLVTLPTDSAGTVTGIVINPTDFSTLSELDPITVTITAPTAGNSLYIFDTLVNRNVTSSVTMVREFDD
jgi:Flp pilus assembly protein TadG